MARTETWMKELSLCALPYAGRAQQDQTPRVSELARGRACSGRPYQPRCPVVIRVHEYT
jgi:hypothetical protein